MFENPKQRIYYADSTKSMCHRFLGTLGFRFHAMRRCKDLTASKNQSLVKYSKDDINT